MIILLVNVVSHMFTHLDCWHFLVCLASLSYRALIALIQSALAGAVEARAPVPIPALVSLGGMDPCVNILVCLR